MEKGAMSPTRKIGNKILTFMMRLLYSINVKDSQSGMWVMKRKFISQIRLQSDDMSLSKRSRLSHFDSSNQLNPMANIMQELEQQN